MSARAAWFACSGGVGEESTVANGRAGRSSWPTTWLPARPCSWTRTKVIGLVPPVHGSCQLPYGDPGPYDGRSGADWRGLLWTWSLWTARRWQWWTASPEYGSMWSRTEEVHGRPWRTERQEDLEQEKERLLQNLKGQRRTSPWTAEGSMPFANIGNMHRTWGRFLRTTPAGHRPVPQ